MFLKQLHRDMMGNNNSMTKQQKLNQHWQEIRDRFHIRLLNGDNIRHALIWSISLDMMDLLDDMQKMVIANPKEAATAAQFIGEIAHEEDRFVAADIALQAAENLREEIAEGEYLSQCLESYCKTMTRKAWQGAELAARRRINR